VVSASQKQGATTRVSEESELEDKVQPTRADTSTLAESTTQPIATSPIHLVVDLNRCQAYAQCCFMAPDVFRLHGEEALWYDPSPDPRQWELVLRAAAACPVQAITVQEPEAMRHRPRKHPGHTEQPEQREKPNAAQRA
jgi:ferredoxin